MKKSFSKVNQAILLELKKHYWNNTKRIIDTVPDLSIDISELSIKEEYKKLLGPSIYFLCQKGFIDLKNRRITITPQGIEELEPFYIRNKQQIIFVMLSGLLGIFGTIIGVVLTLIIAK